METKEFTNWLQNQYIYDSNAITGEVIVGEKALFKTKDRERIEKLIYKINSKQWEDWKKAKLKEFKGEYQDFVNKYNAKKISSKTMLKILSNHPKLKDFKFERDSKIVYVISNKTGIYYKIDATNLFSKREINLSYGTFITKTYYYEKRTYQDFDTLPKTQTNHNEKYKNNFEIFYHEDFDHVVDAITYFENDYGINELEAYLKNIKEFPKGITEHFKNSKLLIEKSEKHLLEKYKNCPEDILENFLDPILKKIYYKLKK